MRTAGIWASGLLASGISGAIVGHALAEYDGGGFFGFIAGALFFTCIRLWLAEQAARAKGSMPVFDLKDDRLQ